MAPIRCAIRINDVQHTSVLRNAVIVPFRHSLYAVFMVCSTRLVQEPTGVGGTHSVLGGSPARRHKPPLEVLPGGAELALDVHLLQPPEPEFPQLVPLLGLAEERLNPDLALAHRPLIGRSRVVAAH